METGVWRHTWGRKGVVEAVELGALLGEDALDRVERDAVELVVGQGEEFFGGHGEKVEGGRVQGSGRVGVSRERSDCRNNAVRDAVSIKDKAKVHGGDPELLGGFGLGPSFLAQGVSRFLNFWIQVASLFLLESLGGHS